MAARPGRSLTDFGLSTDSSVASSIRSLHVRLLETDSSLVFRLILFILPLDSISLPDFLSRCLEVEKCIMIFVCSVSFLVCTCPFRRFLPSLHSRGCIARLLMHFRYVYYTELRIRRFAPLHSSRASAVPAHLLLRFVECLVWFTAYFRASALLVELHVGSCACSDASPVVALLGNAYPRPRALLYHS